MHIVDFFVVIIWMVLVQSFTCSEWLILLPLGTIFAMVIKVISFWMIGEAIIKNQPTWLYTDSTGTKPEPVENRLGLTGCNPMNILILFFFFRLSLNRPSTLPIRLSHTPKPVSPSLFIIGCNVLICEDTTFRSCLINLTA